MSQKVKGNIRSLSPSELRLVGRLADRKLDPSEIVSLEFAREVFAVGEKLRRRVGVLVSREGEIEEVFLGTKDILYLPDLGRYRLGRGRLRRLRLLFSDLSSSDTPSLPSDILTDLEKLRLDLVAGVKVSKGRTSIMFAHIVPQGVSEKILVPDLARFELDFPPFIEDIEDELSRQEAPRLQDGGAVLVHVSDQPQSEISASLDELAELARSAGVTVLDRIIQRKKPDPKSVLGQGKLQEVVLHCLRLGAEHIIFDAELKPSQWRVVTKSTDLKVLDRSMVILDIFAQRAKTSEGALQVELAQLKYNLPRLVEKDAGLSRLTGGIGGRGPGETKLEIGRRRTRERITLLEKKIEEIRRQRAVRRQRREASDLPLVVIVGYTNVGKSTLFNALSGSSVIVENRLFATLDPYQRRVVFPVDGRERQIILSDTVGFVRDLPQELMSAFRATLEELTRADLILHVLDASDPHRAERKSAVEAILANMELGGIPSILVLNKTDLLPLEEQGVLALEGRAISATNRTGLDALLLEIDRALTNPSLRAGGGNQSASDVELDNFARKERDLFS